MYKYKRRCEAPTTHVYYIPKKNQSLQYEKYTQHEFIYREDVKLPLHISNTIKTLWYQLKNINQSFLVKHENHFALEIPNRE